MADTNRTKKPFNAGAELEKFHETQTLPKASSSDDLARMVLALYQHSLQGLKPFYTASDMYRRYYRGDTKLQYVPEGKSNEQHNVIFSNMEAIKPILDSALNKPGISAASPSEVELAKSLERRVAVAWEDSGIQTEKSTDVLLDVLMDGAAFLKIIHNPEEKTILAELMDNRSVLQDPDIKDFDKATWIIQTSLASLGQTKNEFGKEIEPGFSDLEQNENAPEGPPNRGRGTMPVHVVAPVEAPTATNYYNSVGDNINRNFEKAKKVLQLEAWVRDLTRGKDGELVYPEGRVVTIGVGANSTGDSIDIKSPELVVLRDISNPYISLYKEKKRFPFVRLVDHSVKDLWGLSEVFNQIDSQDRINFWLNVDNDNKLMNNNVTKVVNQRSGITAEMLTNKPGQFIIVKGDQDPADAIHTVAPALFTGGERSLQMFLGLNEQDSGAGDVLAGRRPSSITSGAAIQTLQTKASDRFILVARGINVAFVKTYEALAYSIQDFDKDSLFIPVEDASPELTPEEQFVLHDPKEVAGIAFRVKYTKKLKREEVIQLLQVAAQIDSQAPGLGLGGIALDAFEDKSLRNQYKENQKELIEAQQAQAQAQQQAALEQQQLQNQAEQDKQDSEITADIIKETE